MLFEKVHPTEAKTNNAIPNRSIGLLPNRSAKGPQKRWKIENPKRYPLKVSCVVGISAPNSTAIAGIAGRYISTVNGPSAAMLARKIIKVRFVFYRFK